MQFKTSDFQNAKPVYDRSAIMKRAWQDMKGRPFNKVNMRYALRLAWHEAKSAALTPAQSEEQRLRTRIAELESRNRLTERNYRAIDALRAELAGLATGPNDPEPTAPAPLDEKRDLINSARGRICAVDFIKKDGTLRTMCIQPAKLKFHCKGGDATERAQRAAATRKATHPHLMPVWDTTAASPRSVNLQTITRIALNGRTYQFQPAV